MKKIAVVVLVILLVGCGFVAGKYIGNNENSTTKTTVASSQKNKKVEDKSENTTVEDKSENTTEEEKESDTSNIKSSKSSENKSSNKSVNTKQKENDSSNVKSNQSTKSNNGYKCFFCNKTITKEEYNNNTYRYRHFCDSCYEQIEYEHEMISCDGCGINLKRGNAEKVGDEYYCYDCYEQLNQQGDDNFEYEDDYNSDDEIVNYCPQCGKGMTQDEVNNAAEKGNDCCDDCSNDY